MILVTPADSAGPLGLEMVCWCLIFASSVKHVARAVSQARGGLSQATNLHWARLSRIQATSQCAALKVAYCHLIGIARGSCPSA